MSEHHVFQVHSPVCPQRGLLHLGTPVLRLLLALVALWPGCTLVEGHGRPVDPPGRSTMWRLGYDTPPNHDDNQLFCGGFVNQWERNNGNCGVCGDPWQGPRENEAGGKYARGIITRRYQPDDVIRVTIEVTAPHRGWFEFRLCPMNDPRKPATHECLDRHVLTLADLSGTKYPVVETNPGTIEIHLKLPKALTCAQCVFQWKYNAGNSWGTDDEGNSCVGCGPQEQFYGCADVAIGNATLPTDAEIPYWREEQRFSTENPWFVEQPPQEPFWDENVRTKIVYIHVPCSKAHGTKYDLIEFTVLLIIAHALSRTTGIPLS